MSDNQKQLNNIPQIIDIKRLKLDTKEEKLLGPREKERVDKYKNKIYVYKISYISMGKKITGYIIEPKKGDNLPCIIWNRGGSRDFGRIKEKNLFGAHPMMAPLVMQGYIIIASQNPGVDGGEGIDTFGGELDITCITDLYKILQKYTRANHKNVGMYGHSRGGAMTYRVLLRVRWLKAAVIGSAPTNEIRSSKWRKGWARHQKKMWGGSISESKKRSAFFWADKLPKNVPLLLMHGTSDWRVNPLDSIDMSKELIKNKVPHRLIMYEGADHGITQFKRSYRENTFSWFDRFLKEGEKLPNLKLHGI